MLFLLQFHIFYCGAFLKSLDKSEYIIMRNKNPISDSAELFFGSIQLHFFM